jgi:4-amino-4-deoxy-L-arabinose transferase-like glycosyltransferase
MALIASYGVAVGALLGRLSIWLDEILQLLGTRGKSLTETLHWVTENPGASPLGYIAQALCIRTLGFSAYSARLAAALFSILSCAALAWLAWELRVRWASAAVVLFMALPLQFRYALEGRLYSQALFLAVVMTALVLKGARWTWLYGVAVLAGLYTLPFLAFVPLAHLIWIACCFRGTERRSALVRVALAAGLAGALFYPWFRYTRDSWHGIIATNHWHFVFTAKTPLMLVREMSGGGYWLGALLVAAAGLGLVSRRMDRTTKALLVSITVVPVVGALAADAAFDYFLAVRQIIFLLPGVDVLERRWKLAGITALAGLVALALVYDAKWLSRPRENWQTAAAALKGSAEGCLVFFPGDSDRYYRFFEPSLPSGPCGGRRVTLVVSPYASMNEVMAESRKLHAAGMMRVKGTGVGGTSIVTFSADTDDRGAK